MLISEFDLYKREWLSLVFKNRNQKYGAYELRSSYNQVMIRAMSITFFAVATLGITETIIARNKAAVRVEPKPIIIDVDLSNKIYTVPDKPKEAQKKEAQHSEPAKAALPHSTQNINYVVKPNDQVKEDPKPVDVNIASGTVDKIVTGPTSGDVVIDEPTGDGKGTGAGTGGGENETYTTGGVQVLPEPYGGANAWAKFLQKNLRYPPIAQEAAQSGRVYMSFIIEKDGHLSDITVMRKVGYGFDEEATRVLKLAPAWKPGMQNGMAVRVRYTIPINFQISE